MKGPEPAVSSGELRQIHQTLLQGDLTAFLQVLGGDRYGRRGGVVVGTRDQRAGDDDRLAGSAALAEVVCAKADEARNIGRAALDRSSREQIFGARDVVKFMVIPDG